VRTAILLLLLSTSAVAADMLPGTVLVSRWNDESKNTSPGTNNHLAIYVGNGEIVEAQQERGVILTQLSEYLARPQHVTRLAPRIPEEGVIAAAKARSFVGQPYGKFASLGPLWMLGHHNCVSVVRAAYRPVTGPVWGVRIPDHVFRMVQ
jgi:uncharacterized protein YycO